MLILKHLYKQFLIWVYTRQDTYENFISLLSLFDDKDIELVHLMVNEHKNICVSFESLSVFNIYMLDLKQAIEDLNGDYKRTKHISARVPRNASVFFDNQSIIGSAQGYKIACNDLAMVINHRMHGETLKPYDQQLNIVKTTVVEILKTVYFI